ncbi:MAG: DUF6510 family protein [Devosia sp.]
MTDDSDDIARALVLDGNAVAGEMMAMFGVEMTTSASECAHCGQRHMMGALLAYVGGPGIVLRCPSCEGMMVKLVRTPAGTYLDARGAAFVRISAAS